MSVVDKKEIRAVIDCKEFMASGEVIWTFELHDDCAAFQYGNQTCITAEARGQVAGEEVRERKLFDTRYIETGDGWFEKFCLDIVKEMYGQNAKAIEIVREEAET